MLRKIFFTALVFVSHITYGADGNVEEWTTIKNGNMWILTSSLFCANT